MDANQKLRLPLLRDTLVTGVEILDVAKPDTQLLNNDKRWLISQEYTITSFDSALYYLPPFEVLVNDQAYRSKAFGVESLFDSGRYFTSGSVLWTKRYSGSAYNLE